MIERLFPIHRSLTGEGVRDTLRILCEIAPFDIGEIQSGTHIFDWTVPDEWHIRSATLSGENGIVADISQTNLRVVGYSEPIDREMTLEELAPHLHTHPIAIPYRTSYYKRDWGFCMTEAERRNMSGKYHAHIDATLEPGSMTYGSCFIPGQSDETYLITTYCCHPSMYNDNVSGMIVWARLLERMQKERPHYSYQFFIGPETLGILSHLQRNSDYAGAMVIHFVGTDHDYVFKRSIDDRYNRRIEQTLRELGTRYEAIPFSVNGGDERQLQSPAFRIPTVNITTGAYYGTDWYHNSRDVYRDRQRFISYGEAQLNRSVDLYYNVLMNLDRERKIYSLSRHGEPQLGKYGLYPQLSGSNEKDNTATIAKWIMHEHGCNITDVAEKGYTMSEVLFVYDRLQKVGLIE